MQNCNNTLPNTRQTTSTVASNVASYQSSVEHVQLAIKVCTVQHISSNDIIGTQVNNPGYATAVI